MGIFTKLRSLFRKDNYFDALILLSRSYRKIEASQLKAILETLALCPPEPSFEIGTGAVGGRLGVTADTFRFALNMVDGPYLPACRTIEELAQKTPDGPARIAMLEHRAFLSMSVNGDVCPESLRAQSSLVITRIASELIDDETLLLWNANDNRIAFPTEQAVESLRQGDRSQAFDHAEPDEIITVRPGELEAEEDEAKRRWPEFVAAFQAARDKSSFLVKVGFVADTEDFLEFMWLSVDGIEGDSIYGVLLNEPYYVKEFREGAKVRATSEQIGDWGYLGPKGPVGMFTEKKLRSR